MRSARRLLAVLFAAEVTVAILAYCLIAGLLLSDVILRETIGGSIWGAQRLSVYAMIVTGFLGLGLAASRGQHLRPRFADGLVSAPLTPYAERLGSFLMALIFGGFGVVGIEYVEEALKFGDLARIIEFPLWMLQIIVPYAFFSTAVRYLSYGLWPELKPAEAAE